jgi:hypothetical protein
MCEPQRQRRHVRCATGLKKQLRGSLVASHAAPIGLLERVNLFGECDDDRTPIDRRLVGGTNRRPRGPATEGWRQCENAIGIRGHFDLLLWRKPYREFRDDSVVLGPLGLLQRNQRRDIDDVPGRSRR